MAPFRIIQGGMGVGVSNWRLANTVSRLGQLGVVSGTGVAVVLARRLQCGDPDGHMRRAIAAFPVPGVGERVLASYFVPAGRAPQEPFTLTPIPNFQPGDALIELTAVANFVEVFLAKEGHTGVVGINFLEKVQFPHLPSIYGAMLAGVDYILMGAGIPRYIPGILDAFAQGLPAEFRADVENSAPGEQFTCRFDPAEFCGLAAPTLHRPKFLAIISSATLAMTLARKSNGRVDGFIVETAIAGGHNAPPRGPLQLNSRGEPLYGPRDDADLEKIRPLGLPFYMAGGYATPDRLSDALAVGAAGIQVGTAFACTNESALEPKIKKQIIALSCARQLDVFTDPLASPTGFPFKVLQLEGSLSDPAIYLQRTRICDLGYLRKAYRKDDGTLGYRCPAEPVEDYLKKGGALADTAGRKCLCNALYANIGLGQAKPQEDIELTLITVGDDVANVARYLQPGQDSYSAADVVAFLLGQSAPAPEELPAATA
jgi:nitronate monooxygenase